MMDAQEIDLLYRRYAPMVMRRCRRMLSDHEQAMDATQEVFIRMMRFSERLEGQYPSSLLYRMATNVCLNMIRDAGARPAGEPDSAERLAQVASLDDPETVGWARAMLDRIFDREPDSTREMAVMLYMDGMTLEAVARATGLSVSGVRKRMRTLKEKLQNRGTWNAWNEQTI